MKRFHFQFVGVVSYGGETFEFPQGSAKALTAAEWAAAQPTTARAVPAEYAKTVTGHFAKMNEARKKAGQPEIVLPEVPLETLRCTLTGTYDEVGVRSYSPAELRAEAIASGFADGALVDRHQGPRETTSGVLEILPV